MTPDTVTLPTETARDIAAWLRTASGSTVRPEDADTWADLLDPRPTLRDAVARGIAAQDGIDWDRLGDYSRGTYLRRADGALAVVRDHIGARPHPFGVEYTNDNATETFRRALLADLGAES